MHSNSQIHTAEFAASMALIRVFSEATSLPGDHAVYGMQRFTVILVSFIMTAVVFLPLFLAARKLPEGECLFDMGRNKAAGGFFGALIAVYLLAVAAETGLRAHYYVSSTVFDSAPSVYFYVFIGAGVLFALYKGLPASVRSGMIVFAGLIFLFVLMTVALSQQIRPDRLYPALIDEPDTFWSETLREFSQNSEMILFGLLCGNVSGKKCLALPVYLGMSCVMILFMTFLYNTVFGRLTSMLDFPFYTLSSVSDIALLERINGIDVMVWIMSAILKLTFFTFAFRGIALSAFGSEKAANIAAVGFAALSLFISEIFTREPTMLEPVTKLCDTGLPLMFGAVVIMAARLKTGVKRAS